MWSPAADTIAWSTGGVERLRLDSNGNIGVNCASPAAQTIMRLQQAGFNDAGYEVQRTSSSVITLLSYNRNGTAYVTANHDALDHRWFIGGVERSEEHTSELQSLMRISYAVFC